MVSKWRKVKLALGLNFCVFTPRNSQDGVEDSLPPSMRRSNVDLLSPPGDFTSSPASGKLRLSKSLSRSSSSKKTCSICLALMHRRDGQAIFTAECSHSFHFHCIASNVKHGNRICPVCRAKWKELPSSGLRSDSPLSRARITPVDWSQSTDSVNAFRLMPPPRSNSTRLVASMGQAPEPAVYNDDEALVARQTDLSEISSSRSSSNMNVDELRKVTLRTFMEVSAVPRSSAVDSFAVLLHLKAPVLNSRRNIAKSAMNCSMARTPIDLVTVLDISGSMAGTKLALLKRAMGFVIQNLGPNDRLSVIAFSSTARRLFHLRRMSEAGRQQALQAVNSLVANGGTNIAEGLRKGAKIIDERRSKNPVASIILLSDGQDTYTVNSHASRKPNQPNYHMLLPTSLRSDASSGYKIPVHAFGFGMDHDASSMHSISEFSGGTFSFIETEGVIQDAFAQCIGGLLSVVVKDLRVEFECIHPEVRLGGLKAGSYSNETAVDRRTGWIDVGDLYADEERDFLVSVNIPAETSSNETSVLKVRCMYKDPLVKESVTVEDRDVRITRTELAGRADISIEVDRQRNRIRAADAMAEAQTAADAGDLTRAVTVLDNMRKSLSETVSAKSRDQLCIALDAELKEMQDRMTSRHVYEASGRAYILSGMSSHSWQRATARGDSTDGSSAVQSYQTPSMTEMVTRSQAMLLGSPSVQRILRPTWSFAAAQPKPR